MENFSFQKTGVHPYLGGSRFAFLGLIALFVISGGVGCALAVSRPVQEMSYTAAAIRAAKEVQADTLAPELYRQSSEWFFRAKHEYKIKNFRLAKEYSLKARGLAEQAEFEALRNGGIRSDQSAGNASDPLAKDPIPAPADNADAGPGPKNVPYDYPTPQGTPADVYAERKAAEDQAKAQQQ